MPPYITLDPGFNSNVLKPQEELGGNGPRRPRISSVYLDFANARGGVMPYHPVAREYSMIEREMNMAPTQGYQDRLLVEADNSGGSRFFYCLIDGKYGKGRVTSPRFDFSGGAARAVEVGITIQLNMDGERNLRSR
jgi:hypothetical protein